MIDFGAPWQFLWWTLFVLLLAACYAGLGELAGCWLCRVSLWRQKLPEAAFVLGLALWAAAGYAALPVTISARGILPVVALLALTLYLHRPPADGTLPLFLASYLRFRRSGAFRYAVGCCLLLALLVSFHRMWWLMELHAPDGRVYSGSPVWDDARTLGIPVSLAAFGFPLRSPIARGMGLAYPLGAFVPAAGWLAWLPARSALALLLADITCQTAFYLIAVLITAGALIRHRVARLLTVGSATLSGAFNLWNLNPDPQSWWMLRYFGYYKINLLRSTIAWNPYSGLVWIGNHAMAFAALVLAVLWVREKRRRGPAALLVAFASTASMDIPAMALCAVCPLLVWAWWRGRLSPDRLHFTVALATFALALLVLVNIPTLRGAVDSPFDPIFPFTSWISFNLGLLASTTGAYWLVLLASAFACWRLRARWPAPSWWWFPVLTGVAFSLLFEYHTIWFWRFSLASHLLLGLLCAGQLEPLAGTRAWRPVVCLWLLPLLAGLWQTGVDASRALFYGAWMPPGQAEAWRWIREQTPLAARVGVYRPEEAAWFTDVNLLRAGNRAGRRLYDRSHPLTGYQDYQRRMQPLRAGLQGNDYLLVPAAHAGWRRALAQCQAPLRMANGDWAIHEMTPVCRERLDTPLVAAAVAAMDRRDRLPLLLRDVRGDPARLPPDALTDWVILHPEAMPLLRAQVEALWGEGKQREAVALLERVVDAHPQLAEAHYSLAYSLHSSGIDPSRAIHHYSVALAAGYDEFWVRYNRGGAALLAGRVAEAVPDLQRAGQLRPEHPGPRELLRRAGVSSTFVLPANPRAGPVR